MSAARIAAELGTTQSTLRKKYLPDLVASGRLRLSKPAQPNAPDHAYRASEPLV